MQTNVSFSLYANVQPLDVAQITNDPSLAGINFDLVDPAQDSDTVS
jgi:hypothetical protein